MPEIKPAYTGEAMLIRWSENHHGRTVTLQLDPTLGEHHPFKGLQGGLNGQRMQICAVLVDENEQPQNPKENGPDSAAVRETAALAPHAKAEGQDKPRTPFKDLPRSQQAALRCRDRAFQEWLLPVGEIIEIDSTMSEDEAMVRATDKVLKRRLAIISKADLDRWPEVGASWDKLLASYDFRNQVRS